MAIPGVIVALSVGTSEVQNMLNAIPEVVSAVQYRRGHDRGGWLCDGYQHDACWLPDAGSSTSAS